MGTPSPLPSRDAAHIELVLETLSGVLTNPKGFNCFLLLVKNPDDFLQRMDDDLKSRCQNREKPPLGLFLCSVPLQAIAA